MIRCHHQATGKATTITAQYAHHRAGQDGLLSEQVNKPLSQEQAISEFHIAPHFTEV